MNPWIEVTGWTLIHFVWQGALLAIATAAALRLSRRFSAQVRYAMACASLALMVCTALSTAALLSSSMVPPPAGSDVRVTFGGLELTRPALRLPTDDLWADAAAGTMARMDAWLPLLVWAWVAGVMVLMVRFSGGCWQVRRLIVASRTETPSVWQATCERIARRLRVDVPFRVIESTLVASPMVIGWMRPIILLPVALAANMPAHQLEALVAHELAHIRRRDYAVNLVQTLAEALFFFHPGVWWVSARIREEREHCCDDAAVHICGEPATYAEALAELASWRRREAVLSVGAADGLLLARIRRLLGSAADDRPRPLTALVVVTIAVAVVGGAAVLSPTASATEHQASEPDTRVRTTDHFEIHHPPELDLHAVRLELEAERAYERVSGDLRHNLAFKVPIIVFRTTQELQRSMEGGTGQPHGGSFTDASRQRVLVAIDHPADQWFGLLTHEVSHVFGFDIIPGMTTPLWIVEGLAEYERGAWDPSDLAALRELVRGRSIPKLTEYTGADGQNTGRLLYAIGHAGFDFIEAKWGKDGVRHFLLSLRQAARGGGDPYRAAFRIERDAFDQAFDAYLRERFARPAADAPLQRFDAAASLRIEGTITALNPAAPLGRACISLWVQLEGGANQRWAVECGERPADELMRRLQPGDRVIVTGAAPRPPVTQRIAIAELTRPSDGFTWQSRHPGQDRAAASGAN